MEDAKLIIKKRGLQGSPDARRMRREGILPGVIYCEGKEATAIEMEMHAVEQILHHHAGESMLIDIDLDGTASTVLLKEVQHHPVTSDLLHIDLMEVSMDKVIAASIQVELIGEAEGVKAGGLLDHLMHSIDVECLPGDLVEALEVDVSALNIGDSVSVADLDDLGGKLKFLVDESTTVAAVAAPKIEEEEEAEEGEEGAEASAEPEVITEKNTEE